MTRPDHLRYPHDPSRCPIWHPGEDAHYHVGYREYYFGLCKAGIASLTDQLGHNSRIYPHLTDPRLRAYREGCLDAIAELIAERQIAAGLTVMDVLMFRAR